MVDLPCSEGQKVDKALSGAIHLGILTSRGQMNEFPGSEIGYVVDLCPLNRLCNDGELTQHRCGCGKWHPTSVGRHFVTEHFNFIFGLAKAHFDDLVSEVAVAVQLVENL